MGVQVSTLPNGLRVITDSIAEVSTVSLGIWVGVGARHENEQVNGVAHLVEHMLFKGTSRRTAAQISEHIETVGGHINAYTTREQTAYYVKVLKEDVALALDVLGDMLQHSLLDETELNRERTVIVQEIGQSQDTPDDIIYDYVQAAAFPDQTLGLPILGTAEVIRTLPRSALVDYIRRHYTGSQMVISASGNVEHGHIVDLVANIFSHTQTGTLSPHSTAQYKGGEYRMSRDLEQAHLIFGFRGVGYHHPDYYALSVLSTLLGGGMSSRLFQEVREKRGLVYSIHSFASAYKDEGFFGIYAGTGPEHVANLVPVVCDELVKVSGTLTDIEVKKAKTQLRASLLMGMESTMTRCEHWAQTLLIHDRIVPLDETLGKLEAITPDAVARTATRLIQSPLTLAALGPLDLLEPYEATQARLAKGHV